MTYDDYEIPMEPEANRRETMITITPHRRLLPESRLGQCHETLQQFRDSISSISLASAPPPTPSLNTTVDDDQQKHHPKESSKKHYSLIVVTDTSSSTSRGRILLGLKNRGFGKGYYNAFGGKLEQDETPDKCACRELEEETQIIVPQQVMRRSKVGIQRYTFQKSHITMIMHLYHVDLCDVQRWKFQSNNENTTDDVFDVVGCDEITPQWFNDYDDIPYDQMFADDSLWLPILLSSSSPLPLSSSGSKFAHDKIQINGWYHFEENCQETNTILHYFMDVNDHNSQTQSTTIDNSKNTVAEDSTSAKLSKSPYTLEQRLFHAIHSNSISSPSVKEFKECYAFCNIVRKGLANKQRQHPSPSDKNVKKHPQWDVVIDVAGGHGALAALFLICAGAQRAVVLDPANVGKGSVKRAWSSFFRPDQELMYRYECLRTGLPDELKDALSYTDRHRILVVACHACSHLSEEILDVSTRYGVHVAVMPCCQKDFSPGQCWKISSQQLGIPITHVVDLLQCGKIMALGTYDVRMKCIDSKISPQNRIILCRPLGDDVSDKTKNDGGRQSKVDVAHARLKQAYKKAHSLQPSSNCSNTNCYDSRKTSENICHKSHAGPCLVSLSTIVTVAATTAMVGFIAGVFFSSACNNPKK